MKTLIRLYHTVEQHPKRAFGALFLFLIAYQLISVFFGFELCDSGFYMTFYDRIFESPECVEYNFMYYLSGIVGGSFMAILPHAGIFEMRLLGVANNMLIVYLLYRIFKEHIRMSAILVGTLLVVVSYIAMPMTFYNDLLTCLLYVVAIFFLFKGLRSNRNNYIVISGLFVAWNVFARLPNVLDFGIIVLIVLHKVYYRESIRICVRRCIGFTLSFLVGIAGMLLFMKAMGHYEYFVGNLRELTSIANDDSGTCSHTLPQMLYAQAHSYYATFKFGLKALVPCLFILFSRRFIKSNTIVYCLEIAALAGLGWLFYRENPLLPLCAFCIIGIAGNLFFRQEKEVKLLAWAGLSMMVIVPIGSDGGMFNNGSIIFWLATPMATSFYLTFDKKVLFGLPTSIIQRGMCLILIIYLLAYGAKMATDGIYFDGGSIFEKRSCIENNRVKLIYTTPERAKVMNDLLKGIAPHVKNGESLLAYGSLPAIYYLTGATPFAGCSWPELLSVDLLGRRLEHYNGELPLVLRQKFNSIGTKTYQPNEEYLQDCGMEVGHFRSNQKQRIVSRFVENHPYKVVFENEYFILYKAITSNGL